MKEFFWFDRSYPFYLCRNVEVHATNSEDDGEVCDESVVSEEEMNSSWERKYENENFEVEDNRDEDGSDVITEEDSDEDIVIPRRNLESDCIQPQKSFSCLPCPKMVDENDRGQTHGDNDTTSESDSDLVEKDSATNALGQNALVNVNSELVARPLVGKLPPLKRSNISSLGNLPPLIGRVSSNHCVTKLASDLNDNGKSNQKVLRRKKSKTDKKKNSKSSQSRNFEIATIEKVTKGILRPMDSERKLKCDAEKESSRKTSKVKSPCSSLDDLPPLPGSHSMLSTPQSDNLDEDEESISFGDDDIDALLNGLDDIDSNRRTSSKPKPNVYGLLGLEKQKNN